MYAGDGACLNFSWEYTGEPLRALFEEDILQDIILSYI
jgi:hypothetical protein